MVNEVIEHMAKHKKRIKKHINVEMVRLLETEEDIKIYLSIGFDYLVINNNYVIYIYVGINAIAHTHIYFLHVLHY